MFGPFRTADNGLVLIGDTGTGKTALLSVAAELAGDRLVLRCSGVAAEAAMPYAGLHQLLRPLLPMLDRMPAPQAEALRTAFGLREGATDRARFLTAMGALSLLSEVAADRPLAILVDDADRLDEPSRDVVLFALRRLHQDNTVIIATARPGGRSGLDDTDLPALRIGPLGEAHSRALLDAVAGPMCPSAVRALVDEAQGNPLALTELATGLPSAILSGVDPLPEWLPCSERLCRAFGARGLPAATRTLLLLAAAADGADPRPVLAAGRLLGVDRDALGPAERAGLLVESEGELRFRHRITRSAVYSDAEFAERQVAHEALAQVLADDRHQRAWHRSCAGDQPDDALAVALAAVPGPGDARAVRRLRRAVEHSTDPRARADYRVQAAGHAARTGQTEQALALLALDSGSADAVLRARVALARAQIRTGRRSTAGRCLLIASAGVAAVEPDLAALLLTAAIHSAIAEGDQPLLRESAIRMRALDLDAAHPAALLGSTAAGLVDRDLRAPKGVLAYAAPPPARGCPDLEPLAWPQLVLPFLVGFEPGARDRHAVAVDRLHAQDLVGIAPTATIPVVTMDHIAGRWAEAAAAGERAVELADQTGQHAVAAHLRVLMALAAAARGDAETCRSLVQAAWRTAVPARRAATTAVGGWALGLLELAGGAPERAVQQFQDIVTPGRPGHHFLMAPVVGPDLVEAHVRLGDLAAARTALRATAGWRPGPADAPAARGLLRARALAAPDTEDRAALFDAAVAAAVGSPFDLARAELAYGEWLRRDRRIQQARFQLSAALSGFTALGARPWAEHARAELRASGESSGPERGPRLLEVLSPQEARIARMAAGGMTNPEIGARLYLSPRTVRYHLSKVFPKLNITSRHQLRDLGLAEAAGG